MSYVNEPFEELDVLNFFMFNKLTTEEGIRENFCRCLIRNLLGKEVSKVDIQAEKIEFPDDPEKRGVRLDVVVKEFREDENVTIYDIEPHRDREADYPRKNRYTQAMIDKNNLASGDNNFSHLPDMYIICITNYDPFGYDRMLYTFKNSCVEEPQLLYNDGRYIMYFNTTGTKGGSESLKNFLLFLEESKESNVVDEATKEVNQYMDTIKLKRKDGAMFTFGQYVDNVVREAVAEKDAEIADKDAKLADKDAEIEKLKKELESYQKQES